MDEQFAVRSLSERIASALLLFAGGLLLLQSLFGVFAILMFGFDSLLEWTTALCLTLAFPLYLIGLKSLRVASRVLWAFFLAQWINECFIGQPPSLVNPLDWPHGDTLLAAIVLVQLGYWMLARTSTRRRGVALREVLPTAMQ